jgi:CRP-like cAMP-binding protein
VTRDGVPLRTLDRGEGLGEIALPHGVTRTATVTALAAAALVEIDREAFLFAVTGHGQTSRRAELVASGRLLADTA